MSFIYTETPKTYTIESCIDCPFHKVVPNPDPCDWFCDDDVAVICTRSDKTPQKLYNGYNYAGGEPVCTYACRPYSTRNETSPVPDWCPLQTEATKEEV